MFEVNFPIKSDTTLPTVSPSILAMVKSQSFYFSIGYFQGLNKKVNKILLMIQ